MNHGYKSEVKKINNKLFLCEIGDITILSLYRLNVAEALYIVIHNVKASCTVD
jgi:hypothetical protein